MAHQNETTACQTETAHSGTHNQTAKKPACLTSGSGRTNQLAGSVVREGDWLILPIFDAYAVICFEPLQSVNSM